jgi:sarcosine oxidase subunit beta
MRVSQANPQVADAVIVGAGILGAAAAYELAKAGLSIVVLERGAPNRESSGATAGNVQIQGIHTRRPGQAIAADVSVFLPLQRAASNLWDTLEAELDATVELRRGGGFMVAETIEEVAELRAKHEMEHRFGLATTLLDGNEARHAFPLLSQRILAADYCSSDGFANPLLVTVAYLEAAVRFKARLRPFTPVTEIVRKNSTYLVNTPSGVWETPIVVNTAGAWISHVAQMAGISLGMSPVAIQMHATTRAQPVMSHVVHHVGEGLSVKQVAAGNILIGGGWPAHELNLDGRSTVSLSSMISNVALARRVLPFLADLRILRIWAGPLAATPDELPVIGEVPGAAGFLVAGGTYGFTLAPLWGKVLKDLALGLEPQVSLQHVLVDRLTSGISGVVNAQ